MNKDKEILATWNKIASLYEEQFMDLEVYNETYDFICHTITRKNAHLLEIGCGPGNITKYLLTQRPDFDILGIDIAPNMITLAKKNNPTASFEVMDTRNIDQIKHIYDGIVIGFCLPYLSPADCQQLITDCYQLLNEDGLLYLSFVEGDPDQSGYQVSSTGDKMYFHYYTLEDLKSTFKKNQFEELNTYQVEYKKSDGTLEIHTIFIAKKITEV